MEPDVRIISIGAMAAHPVWGESSQVRTGHATTSLVRCAAADGERLILIDPSLPAEMLAARLDERTGLKPDAVTHVFLTSMRPDVRRGLALFENVPWWVHEAEREAIGVPMAAAAKRAMEAGDDDAASALAAELQILGRCEPAPDQLGEGVDLFPLPGVSPGQCGVLLATARHTTVVAGDAVASADHLREGKLFTPAADVDLAKESFEEVAEIADLIVPGRDNLLVNPGRTAF